MTPPLSVRGTITDAGRLEHYRSYLENFTVERYSLEDAVAYQEALRDIATWLLLRLDERQDASPVPSASLLAGLAELARGEGTPLSLDDLETDASPVPSEPTT